MQEAIIILDVNEAIEYANQRLEDISGYKVSELIGVSVDNYFFTQETYAGGVKDSRVKPLEVLTTFERYQVKKDGCKWWSLIKSSPYKNSDGKTIGRVIMMTDITKQKIAERKLKDSERKHRLLFEQNPVPMLIYDLHTLDILDVNSTAVDKYGYSRDEFLTMSIKALRPVEDEAMLMDDIEQVRKGIERAGEWVHCLKNGALIDVEITAKTISYNGRASRLVLMKDISRVKRAQDELLRSEEKYRRIIENMNLGIVEIDNQDRITKVYDSFANMTGYSVEELRGQKYMDVFLNEASKKNMACQSARRMDGAVGVYEVQLEKKDGEPLWALISAAPLYDENNRIVGSIGIHLDTTDRKKLVEELIHARECAEESSKAKERFLANMSHEIRTPMNAIIGLSHLMQNTGLTSQQAKHLSTLQFSARNLLVIINDILDYSKIESGNMTLETTGFNIHEMLAVIESSLGCLAKEKGIDMEFNIDDHIASVLLGDPVRLNQILTNLVNNSIKFTEKGRVNVTCVLIEGKEGSQKVLFEVLDTGIGISKGKVDLIFKSFTQEDESTTRKFGGTGLGLAISKRFVELMDGELHVKSIKGKGTCFSFGLEFPLGTDDDLESRRDTKINSTLLKDVKLLLVEDNVVNLEMIKHFLDSWKISVDVASEGKEAINILSKKTYDIVLMDMYMPVMGGVEATKVIREELKSDIPIIALTANAMVEDRAKCLDAGMDDYVSKPFEPIVLFNKIATQLDIETLEDEQLSEVVESVTVERENEEIKQPCNLSKLYVLYSDNALLVNRLLKTILRETPIKLEAFKKGLKSEDYDSIYRTAHSLKPTIDLLDMANESDGIREIESIAKSKKRLPDLLSLIERLDKVWSAASKQLEVEINQNDDGMATVP